MKIRKTELSDISEIASLHSKLFDKQHFTACFTNELLKKYFTFLIEGNEHCYSLIHDNQIKGYIISGENIETSLKKFLIKYFPEILLRILKNPRFIPEKLNSFISGIFLTNESEQLLQIYIIAADSTSLPGSGRELLRYYEKEIMAHRINKYGLSVRKNNTRAIKFYINNGFKEISKSRYSIAYRKDLE